MHATNRTVLAAVEAAGITPRMVWLDEHARTAALAAAQIGCDVGAIANSLVFAADGEPLLVMASGAARVDTDLVARTAVDIGLKAMNGTLEADFPKLKLTDPAVITKENVDKYYRADAVF